jgi:xanthine dehydrogenase YagR molybdenum-binding subunit
MDELSYALKIDPLELRLRNFAEKDPANDKPWSSNYLKECYKLGAERFGWEKRKLDPGMMHSGEWLLGMGMSAGIYKADRAPANASATLRLDGTLLVQTSVADVGPGSATIMTQIAAEAYRIEADRVKFQWGHSTYPLAPGQFGSHTTASTGSAVYDAVKALQQRLKEMAVNTKECPFFGRKTDDLSVEGDNILVKNEGTITSTQTILKLNNLTELKVTKESKAGPETEQFSGKSFCAHFVEVMVHPTTGVIKVSRVVSAIDAGKVINHKTAVSQVYGAVTWGIGFALMEEGIVDHRYGRYVNNNLADYHVPVNADIPHIDVLFVDQPDPVISPMGAKGLGEIGIVGFSAAIANAVFHATGKRFRSLPIKLDKLI